MSRKWKHNYKYFLSITLVLIVFDGLAQAPEIEWQKSYGTSGWDEGNSILQTVDGGYLVAGGRGGYDGDAIGCAEYGLFWVLKLMPSGEIEWSQCYGGNAPESAESMIQTLDGGYILSGYTYSNDGDVTGNHSDNSDCWVVKINSTGGIEWENTYGGNAYESSKAIIQTLDGGYIFCATSDSNEGDVTGHHGGIDNSDYWIVKINLTGSIEWEKSLGGTDDEYVHSIQQTSDGKYIIAGSSQSNNGDVTGNHGESDYWIVKLNEVGEIIWQKTYGGTDGDRPYSIIETSEDRSIIAVGESYSNNLDVSGQHGASDIWIIKADSVGNLLWQKCLGGTNWDRAYDVLETEDKGYIIAGLSHSNNGDVTGHHGSTTYSDFWIIQLDSLGDILWQQSYGGTGNEECNSIQQSDTGFILAGISKSTDGDVTFNNGDYDYWIVKLEAPCDPIIFFADTDGDGYGDILSDSISCDPPFGYVIDSSDCNDVNNLIFPAATDICNTIDDNCNGLIDEDATFTTWYLDNDSDGFGDILNDSLSCFDLPGYVMDNTDCNDTNSLINPATIEICNDIDDNCNFDIDEGLTINTFYIDADGDNFGDADIFINSCLEIIAGYVFDSTDCNDANNLIYSGAIEICDYLDNDCNGIIDDNLTYIHSFEDADADNYGNMNVDSLSCEIPDGFVEDDNDCDDSNPFIYPGADEILNGVDDDCNTLIDEGLVIINTLLNSISIYPNPADNVLYLEHTLNEEATFQIINSLGEIIYLNKLSSSNIEIDVSSFAAGMYWLKINAWDFNAEFQIVKE